MDKACVPSSVGCCESSMTACRPCSEVSSSHQARALPMTSPARQVLSSQADYARKEKVKRAWSENTIHRRDTQARVEQGRPHGKWAGYGAEEGNDTEEGRREMVRKNIKTTPRKRSVKKNRDTPPANCRRTVVL